MRHSRFIPALALVLGVTLAPIAASAQQAKFAVDTVHSELSFRIRHLFGRVAGTFGDWGGVITTDTLNLANTQVDVTIQARSIDTRVPQRDDHLRTPDFFAVDSFPTLTFKSTKVGMAGNIFRVHGDLTIRGHTRPVVLEGTFAGLFDDPWGGRRIAFMAKTRINRNDFGVSFNGPFEAIGQIGDMVDIELAVEAVRL